MNTVVATREGLEGHGTSIGWPINDLVPFCALPTRAALYQWIIVENTKGGLYLPAVVLDVGPWNEDDDAYVFGGDAPAAARGIGKYRTPTNPAGIDLGQLIWQGIAMADNGLITWGFWADLDVQRRYPDAFDRLSALIVRLHGRP